MEHDMCISQDQYNILVVMLDGVKSDICDISKEIGQIHDAVYGNGKEGLLTRMSVIETTMRHLEKDSKEQTDGLKELHEKDSATAEKHRVNWKDVAYIVFPVLVFVFQYLFTKVL